MSRVIKVVLALVLCSPVIVVPSVWAYWIQDGVAVCTATGTQQPSSIVSDGLGGAVITWTDNRSGSHDIYAQRVDAMGIVKWTADGVALCVAANSQNSPAAVSDGASGAIVVWSDYRSGTNYDIYAQRVNASGVVQWTANGVALCTATADQWPPAVVSDGMGGAIVVWSDYRSGTNFDIYAQHVNASGVVLWTADGVALCTATGNQWSYTIASDGKGGAIVVWSDYRSGTSYDIYVQRVNASGVVQWPADGIALCTAAGSQGDPAIISDGASGAIVAWYDLRSGNHDLYVQRVNASGVVQWPVDGAALCTATGDQADAIMISDGIGGAIVAWYDYRSENGDIYAQRVNSSGIVQWTANGVALCTETAHQQYPQIVSGGASGAIVTWQDLRSGNHDIYAQHVNASGAVQWTANGVALCAAAGSQENPAIISDGAGGVLVTWADYRNGDFDIYIQSADAYGRVGKLAPEIYSIRDVPGDEGGMVYVSWYAAHLDVLMDRTMSQYSIWRAISPTQALTAIDAGASALESLSELDAARGKAVVRIEQAGEFTYFWELVETVDALYMDAYGKPVGTLFDSTAYCNEVHYFQVVAHTTNPQVFWKSEPDSGYSVDNLAPCPPLCLAGEQSYVPEGLSLTWKRNGEADIDCYRVYRGLAENFVPSEGNRLGSPCDTVYFDSGWSWSGAYYYKVSAMDVHGNESGFALLTPNGVTGNETPVAPYASYLAQNYPNPFNPMTKVAFGLAAPAQVSLRIYDSAGRLVRALLEGARAAGHYTEIWDGRDEAGRGVSSGVYFCRFDGGTFTQTRKMILLR